jgi:MFS transporter, PPP family, 3-phenylpropionic acid transporter
MKTAARLRLLYFLYYGYVGTYLPHFAAYLRGAGFTGEQIGTVQMLPSLLSPAIALAWAGWADRVGTAARALRRAAVWAAACVLLLPLARTPLALGAVLVAFALGDRAIVPLTDAITLEWTHRHRQTSYARVRLFGSLGFVAFSVAVGAALAARGDRAADLVVPATVVFCVAAYALVAARVPAQAPVAARPGRREVTALLHDRALLTLLGGCAFHWAACAPYHLFFGVLVRDLGLPSHVTGLGMAVGVGAELVALLLFPRLAARWPVRGLFAAAFAGSALRWLLVAAVTGAPALVAVQLLHGLTFGLFWACAMHALGALVPPALRATGQAVFAAVVFGLGNTIGYYLSGVGYDRFGGAAPLFAAAAALELVPLVATLVGLRATAWRAPDALSRD